MKYRTRNYYTDSQKALMWARWKEGWTLQQIGQLFDRPHTSAPGLVSKIHDESEAEHSDRGSGELATTPHAALVGVEVTRAPDPPRRIEHQHLMSNPPEMSSPHGAKAKRRDDRSGKQRHASQNLYWPVCHAVLRED
jgi:hypothetical protein